jgi:hypothetical protein
MVDGKKHIDEFFRDGLQGYEPEAPAGAWDEIRHRMDRRLVILPVWRRVAAAAAVLIICLTTWLLIDHPSGKQYTQNPKGTTAPIQESVTPSPLSKPVPVARTREAGATETSHTWIASVSRKGETTERQAASPSAIQGQYTGQVSQREEPSMDFLDRQYHGIETGGPATVVLPVPLTAVESPMATEEWTVKRGGMRWGIAGQFSPMYTHRFLTSREGNNYMVDYYDKIEGGLMTYSGGLMVNMLPSKRLMISAGLYYSTMGQSIKGVSELTVSSLGWETHSLLAMIQQKYYLVDNSTGVLESGNKYVNILGGPGQISDITSGHDQQMTWSDLSPSDARVIQNFEFLELPVVLRYKVVDRKLGINLVGGFSTNFLVGNHATFYLGNKEYSTVTTTNLNGINYSSIVGMGFDYELMPRLLLNIEPTFKYYLNSFSSKNLIGSHPYALGMMSGLRFIF